MITSLVLSLILLSLEVSALPVTIASIFSPNVTVERIFLKQGKRTEPTLDIITNTSEYSFTDSTSTDVLTIDYKSNSDTNNTPSSLSNTEAQSSGQKSLEESTLFVTTLVTLSTDFSETGIPFESPKHVSMANTLQPTELPVTSTAQKASQETVPTDDTNSDLDLTDSTYAESISFGSITSEIVISESTLLESTFPETTTLESSISESTFLENSSERTSWDTTITSVSYFPETTILQGNSDSTVTSLFPEGFTENSPDYTSSESSELENTTTEGSAGTETNTNSVTTEGVPDSSGDSVNIGLIVGITITILFLGVGLVIWRTHSSGRLLWPPKNLFSNRLPNSIRPQPISLKKFLAHCNEMFEVPSKLSHEYQLLGTLSTDIYATESFVAGQLPENKSKNRYVNILPFDSTRVKLVSEGDEIYNDYINASYIKGFTNEIEYIATQGPKEETCRDFWRMVFQEPIKVIVMVTQLEEQGKHKCYKYFPNMHGKIVLEDITVQCTNESHFSIYTTRTFILMKGEKKRSITHLHFREWPDFGCPATPDLMLHFCQVMRQYIILAQPGITLIHCSAGVGRTGTLIAVDILLQHLKEKKKIDIFGTVYKLRKHRINMVQSEAQYVYIYKCIKEALEDTSYLSAGSSSTTSLEPIYENIECTRLSSLPSKAVPDICINENECAL